MYPTPRSIVALSIIALLGLAERVSAQVAPDLGAAGSFAVLGATTVTNAGLTTVTGDLGVSPGTAITGFPPGSVLGTMYPGGAEATAAQGDAAAAFGALSQTCTNVPATSVLGNGQVLSGGVHCFAGAATVEGTLVFDDNNPNAVFIVRIATTLTTGANTNVWMLNGTGTNRVFWQIGSSATLGANSSFAGNLMALTSISMGSGVTMTGRAIALEGAVTLDNDQITIPMADVAAGKFTFGNVVPGATFTYHIDVFNRGALAAEQVTLSDPLPPQLTFVSSDTDCTALGQLVTCPTFPVLEPGDGSIFRIVVRLNPAYIGNGSEIDNVATTSTESPDGDPDNDASSPSSPAVIAPNANLSITKAAVEASVSAGQTFTYRVIAANAGPSTAVNVSVTDTLPASLSFVSSPQSCALAAGVVSCPTIASLAPAATATFDLVVRLDPAYTGNGSDIQNVATVTSATADAVPGNNTSAPAGPPTIGAAPSDVELVKTASLASVRPGETFSYTFAFTNNGPAVATGVVVTDALPAQVAFVSSVSGCTAVGQTVTCPATVTLAVGNSIGHDVTVQLSPDYVGDGSNISNTASVTSTTEDSTPENNTSTVLAPPVGAASADVTIVKSLDGTPVPPGGTFGYSVLITNLGPSTATNIVAADTLPAGLTFVASGDGCTAVGQASTCPTILTLAPGAARTFGFTVRLDPGYAGDGSDLPNVASFTMTTTDPVPANNTSPAVFPTIGTASADLSLTKSVSASPVTPGSTFTYTVQVTNNGPSVAAAVVITDPLPVQTTFVSSLAGCTVVGQNVTCPTVATLAVGATVSVDIVVQLNPAYTGDGTDVLNSASVAAATLDPTPANNTNPAGAPPLVGPPGADVTVVKTVSAAPVTAGETFTYTLLVSNQGPSTATDVATSDVLPPGITFVSSADACVAVGQSVTCPPIASFAPAGSRSFGLVVRLDANYTGDGSDLPNRGTVAAATPDPVPANNTSAPVTPAVGAGSADLSALKVALGDSVSPGMLFTYRISVTNAGPSAARDVTVTDTLPAPLAFVSSLAGCTAVGQVVTCLRPIMSSGTTADVDVTVRLDAAYAGNGADLANTATVTTTTSDPTPANNTTAPAPPPPLGFGEADLIITKNGPSGTVPPNSEITYSIVVTNQGPGPASSVVVQDPTPAGLTLIATAGDCVTAFPCALGTVLPGRARTITARYATGSTVMSVITNTATVSSPTPDPSPGSNTATAATPAEPRTYYLAEGATGAFWSEDIAIANPSLETAPVTVTYLTESGSVITTTLAVPPRSHVSVHVNDVPGLASSSASAQITSENGVPLAVERTMTWDATMYGGHTETAAIELATEWYFAEGALGYFETFLLVGNPQATATTVTVTFLREAAPPVVRTLSIGAHARLTLAAGAIPELFGRAFGMVVQANQPIVAERSMYFGTTPTRLWSGGHASGGVTAPSRRWFYAEGATGSFFDTFILLSNPQLTAAHVTMEYLLPSGTVIAAAKVVPARGRLTVSIDNEADARLHAATVSTRITSDLPIVTERSMYWGSKPDVFPWSEGHNSFGVDQAAERWAVAGGRIGGPNHFQTYVLLSNPWTAAADVTVTYLRDGQPPIVRTLTVPPTTRYTLAVGTALPELEGEEFGVAIAVTNGVTINVERSIYWDANGVFWTAGTNAVGTRLP